MRRNPYVLDDLRPGLGTGLVVVLWRWRTEIVLFALAAAAVVVMAGAAGKGLWWAPIALAGSVSVPATLPAGRKWIARHFWCLFSRHRLQRVCLETSMHTRKGRIPLVLWITPTDLGERAFILLRAGICAEDFEAFAGEIAAACYATAVQVERHPRRAQFVTVEILRRGVVLGAGTWGDGTPDAGQPVEKLAG
ncbi:hypothetical protein SAMN05444920_114128 [Nonomuraea solani]|uniref:Uncharacterized protein n=2 Tax=Nonomuraea solani TaxID=1144553 RepID=A0A1H6EPV1_9ACTN|nr:hypothetical protein SAMN05444920_114128 [Nonomuraea solani]